jgi:hypothetical protein
VRYNSSGENTPGFRPDRSRLSHRWLHFVKVHRSLW